MVTRRDFLKITGAAASLAVFGATNLSLLPNLFQTKGEVVPPDDIETEPGVEVKYSVCLQCHSACGIKCKIKDGRLIKIDGNPYHPNTLEPHIPYTTSPTDALQYVGTTCPKGQAGVQTLYDPYRIQQPLKRTGPKGSGKWEAITWEQAIDEIINGGVLPGAKEGESNYTFEGLSDIRKYISKSDVETILGVTITDFVAKSKTERDAIISGLSTTDRATLEDKLIDINKPELGPKSNQLLHMVGRAEHGRKEFTDRFFGDYFGTLNLRNDHTDICELSHHVAYKHVLGKTKFGPDILNCEFMILFGSSVLEAGFPALYIARKYMLAINEGRLKYVVVDPRYSRTAAHSTKWVPVKPGGDGALAMGMIRWILENGRYDDKFLENTTESAANADDETCWTNATHLVNTQTWEDTDKVVEKGTTNVVDYDSVDHGELDIQVEIGGVIHKTAFRLLRENAEIHTIVEYSTIAGIDSETTEWLADEFTRHGKKAIVHFYRGPVQHTNGLWTALALITLNLLIGNPDWRGGFAYGGHDFHEMDANYDLKGSTLKPGKVSPWGIRVSRGGAKYEETTEFTDNGYPATRPYFPLLGKDICHVALEGIADQYPYPTKAVFTTMANFNYSVPAMKSVIENTFKDSSKVPLFVAFDIIIGEFSSLADYILPEGTLYEQWATPHVHYHVLTRTGGLRQPVVDQLYPGIKLIEDILIQIGKEMGFQGYGNGGLGAAGDLNSVEDWYLKAAANLGYYAHNKGIPGIKDIDLEEDQISYVRARGGVFEGYDKAYDTEPPFKPHHKWKKMMKIYSETLGMTKDSMTGEYFPGLAKHVPIADAKGGSVDDEGYPYFLITYKTMIHAQSRTAANPYLMELWPENWIIINAEDAASEGIVNGDTVKITSATNTVGVTGKAKLREGIRPGVIAISHNYGHWQYGSSPNIIDGVETDFDSSRASGTIPNPVMRLDNSIGGTIGLTDKAGGSASFSDTKVKLEKV